MSTSLSIMSMSTSMATTTHPPPPPPLTSIHSLICFLHHHLRAFLADRAARRAARRQCLARLAPSSHGRPFDPSDEAVLSRLRDAIGGIDTAVEAKSAALLTDIEEALQMPALLDEDGATAGVENRCVAACAYFYLALIREMQGDQWQMAMHFLQAVLVSAELVRDELAPPALWHGLFDVRTPRQGADDGVARQVARRYKDWLMYYKVVAAHGHRAVPGKECSVVTGSEAFSSSVRCIQFGSSASSLLTSWPDFAEDYEGKMKACTSHSDEREGFAELKDLLYDSNGELQEDVYTKESSESKCLQDMLQESQSDSPVSFYSHVDSTEASDTEAATHDKGRPPKVMPIDVDSFASKLYVSSNHQKSLTWCSSPESAMIYAPESPVIHVSDHQMQNNSILDFRDVDHQKHDLSCFSDSSSKFMNRHGSSGRKCTSVSNVENFSDVGSRCSNDVQMEFVERFEKAVSTLCLSDGLGSCLDAGSEATTVWQLLHNSAEVKCRSVRQDVLGQLLDSISASKKDAAIRASVYILLLMISEDRNVMRGIKRKDLHLRNLAGALKRNVHEAAILIYLLDPSPSEMKRLEILPSLLHAACNSDTQKWPTMLPLTPTSASIALIELLVTAFDYVTNNVHLAAISSPRILSKLVNVAKNKNLEEGVALAGILVRCVRLNGNCRKFLSQATPVDPFLHLLRRRETRAKCAALEYFHEILQIPRSSAICLLQEIRRQGGLAIMHTLMACLRRIDLEHRLWAANLLIQLDMMEKLNGKSVFKEEAMEVLLASLSSEDNCNVQTLAASILSNIGGTYAWTGESYTAAWLVRKAGLASTSHRNMIRNIDWLDPCLQDSEISTWGSRIACRIIKAGIPVFNALAKGIQSKVNGTSRDCLVCAAWLGNEMAAIGENSIRYAACEILLDNVARYLHPGVDLDVRILACVCVYNYTSGKGKQKLMSFSEGLRESLRRLSSFTWMAEELLQVTDYFLTSKTRVSCVHTQILEVGQAGNVAATAITFFRGQLFVGYSDGTIRAWDIKGQRAGLVREIKEHKKAVTCFALFEMGDNLLSGSTDKTIHVWKMAQRKLECVEVIHIREAVRKLDTYADKIIIITQNNALKLSYTSRSTQNFCQSKHVKSLAVAQGKAYLGCDDFSIQEMDMSTDTKIKIRVPARSWRITKQPVNSIVVYKDWMYCAGALVEGSSLKDWRKRCAPKITMAMPKGTDVQAMAVGEDFIYLNCRRSPSIAQVWLREKQQKVGRLSAGAKITSLFTANDIIFCGTETGLIKAWIPL